MNFNKALQVVEGELCNLIESSGSQLVGKCNKLLNDLLLSIVSNSETIKTDIKSYIEGIKDLSLDVGNTKYKTEDETLLGERKKWAEKTERLSRKTEDESLDKLFFPSKMQKELADTTDFNFGDETGLDFSNLPVDSKEEYADEDDNYGPNDDTIDLSQMKTEGQMIFCNECPYKNKNKSHVKHHVKNVHRKIKDLYCDLCQYATGQKSSLITHKKLVHNVWPIEDPTRGRPPKGPYPEGYKYNYYKKVSDTPSADKLKWMEKVEQISRNDKEEDTDEKSSSSIKLKGEVHVPPSFNNDDESDSDEDSADHADKEPLFSKDENSGIGDKDLKYKEVDEKIMKTDGHMYFCNECSYQSKMKTHVTIHVKNVHKKIKDYFCPRCEYSSGRKGGVKMHLKLVHRIY